MAKSTTPQTMPTCNITDTLLISILHIQPYVLTLSNLRVFPKLWLLQLLMMLPPILLTLSLAIPLTGLLSLPIPLLARQTALSVTGTLPLLLPFPLPVQCDLPP